MRKAPKGSNAELGHRLKVAFGAKLAEARRGTVPKTTQAHLAKALGVSRASVSNIENGRHRIFLDQLYIIAKALRRTPDTLLPSPGEVDALDSVLVPLGAGIERHQQALQNTVTSIRARVLNDPDDTEEV